MRSGFPFGDLGTLYSVRYLVRAVCTYSYTYVRDASSY